MTIVELDTCLRIDDAGGKKLAYFYFDTTRFPLPGGLSKAEAERVAEVCLDALRAAMAS